MPIPRAETLDELLFPVGDDDRLEALFKTSGVSMTTLRRLRRGIGNQAHLKTIQALADALAVPFARVDAAVRASRAEAKGMR